MILLPIHIIGGLLGIASGFVAIFAFKGAKLHRKNGMVFVYAMLALTTTGSVMAIANRQPFNLVAAGLTFYLVLTGLLTVRRPAVAPGRHAKRGRSIVRPAGCADLPGRVTNPRPRGRSKRSRPPR